MARDGRGGWEVAEKREGGSQRCTVRLLTGGAGAVNMAAVVKYGLRQRANTAEASGMRGHRGFARPAHERGGRGALAFLGRQRECRDGVLTSFNGTALGGSPPR